MAGWLTRVSDFFLPRWQYFTTVDTEFRVVETDTVYSGFYHLYESKYKHRRKYVFLTNLKTIDPRRLNEYSWYVLPWLNGAEWTTPEKPKEEPNRDFKLLKFEKPETEPASDA